MFDLTDKRRWHTAASAVIARALHRQAPRSDRRHAAGALAARRRTGERAHPLTADLADLEAVDRLVRRGDGVGQIDILVNNAGITCDTRVADADEDWRAVIEVNLTAVWLTCAARHRRAPPRPGHLHHVGGRGHWQRRAGQLRGGKGGADRHGSRRRRDCDPRHHGQLHRAGHDHHRDDRQIERGTAGPHRDGDPDGRSALTHRRRGRLSGERRGRLRPQTPTSTRHGDDMSRRMGSVTNRNGRELLRRANSCYVSGAFIGP